VEYGETELELYTHVNNDSDAAIDGSEEYVFEVARGIAPELFLEAKFISERAAESSLTTDAFAIEAIYQLTEQGEYSWDFGLLGEVVYSRIDSEVSEVELGGILATDLSPVLRLTTNIIAEYESAEEKFEGGASAMLKWRLQPALEPAVEVYSDEYTSVLGPVVSGTLKSSHNKFGYELGVLFGVTDESPDSTLKAKIEYEF
jgi:hypothetical protein